MANFTHILLKLLSTVSMFIFFIIYVISPLAGTYYLLCGPLSIKIVLVALLIYQYGFCRKSQKFIEFCRKLNMLNFFDEYGLIIDDQSINGRKENTLICHHPHGVMTFGMAVLSPQLEFFDEYIYLGSRMILVLPWGGIIMILRGIQGVDPENFKDLMKKKKNMIIIPGGFEEATITNYNEDRVFIKDRKGFIKYALQYGYKIYPSYCFNENKTHYYFTWIKLGHLMNKIKMPGVIFMSKFLNFLPNQNVKLITVIGEGIQLPLKENASKEDVNFYHEVYIKNLTVLFDKYKERYGGSKILKLY